MRLMSRVGDMGWWFWFSLLLAYLRVTDSTTERVDCLSQPNGEIQRTSGQSAVLQCNLSDQCSAKDAITYQWFAFKGNGHHLLSLDNHKYGLDGASLYILSLSVNDSGIYHCAAVWSGTPAPGKQRIGPGTTLLVRERTKPTVGYHLLMTFLVLLIFYSLALIVLIILQKCGWNKGLSRRKSTAHMKQSIKTEQFHNVVRELHSRSNLSQQIASRNGSPEVTTSPKDNTPTDAIYQNFTGGR
ncbi:immunoglobulin superfamily member 6 [Thalassophryne amazonica]|uniref:immunoglobulin superfamily member 6 n=1 Tax=Thalassophryne amazonica TaxID=390379 RepID=UPI00147252DF|nr:immunoglobulin superfamily member 6 [Thalassophryne amazonica]